MLQLLHKRDLADGSAWRAFFAVEVDFFERNEFTGLPIPAFENLMIHGSVSRLCEDWRLRAYRGICPFPQL